jgi:CHAT domain-containing protein
MVCSVQPQSTSCVDPFDAGDFQPIVPRWSGIGHRQLKVDEIEPCEILRFLQSGRSLQQPWAAERQHGLIEQFLHVESGMQACAHENGNQVHHTSWLGAGLPARTASMPSNMMPAKRDRTAETSNLARLTAIDTRIAAIDKRLVAEFPDYAALAAPQSLSVEEVQADLRPDEALVLFLGTSEAKPTPEETFIWVVTKTDMRWVRSDLGTPSLRRDVAVLRCGLDYDGAWQAKDSQCAALTGVNYTGADDPNGKALPFDASRAHALYKALFGEIEDLIKGKHLLIVPSGPLTQLPFHVLVTAKPEAATPTDSRKIDWFARSNANTVLPAVSSLKALRQNAKPSRASKPFLGVGNPLLDGADARYAKRSEDAIANEDCAALAKVLVADVRDGGEIKPFTQRGGIADVAMLRQFSPLPETAEELCDVAKAVGAQREDVLLGSRASEAEIKRLSGSGKLRDYRILHFATHGALAGEVLGSAEPGLLLTPPATGSEADDGYLSASEIAGLKLDADWVILSACNTAAGGAQGAEALSGLARAFFYAGARSLLVSHWYVDSEATVALIKGGFAELEVDSKIGRAEAMRRSMLALIDRGEPPSSWAPFIIVGEGAVAR